MPLFKVLNWKADTQWGHVWYGLHWQDGGNLILQAKYDKGYGFFIRTEKDLEENPVDAGPGESPFVLFRLKLKIKSP